jgi:hypothetical protein
MSLYLFLDVQSMNAMLGLLRALLSHVIMPSGSDMEKILGETYQFNDLIAHYPRESTALHHTNVSGIPRR